MPCLYGACFYLKKNSACAYVDEKGKTHLISCKNQISVIPHNIIFLRGLEYLIFGLYFFVKNLVKIPFVYTEKSVTKMISKNLNVGTKQILSVIVVLIASVISILFIGIIPVKLAVAISGYSANNFVNKLLVVVIKLVLLFGFLLIIKCFVPFKQFYRFNACSNILIDESKKNIHRPTNFLNFLVFSFSFIFIVVSLIGLTGNAIWKPLVNLLISVLSFSVCYEILLLMENSKLKWVNKMSIITSFFITEKPSKTEEYIALSALNEVIFMQDKKRGFVDTEEFKNGEVSFSSIYAENKEKLKNAGIVDASEIDWLICEVLGINRGQIRLQTKISVENKKKIENAVQKRIKGEPITKIFGHANFYGYDFKVNKDVLSPRMETEILVENVLKFANDKMNILDLCTGSGVIAISIAKNVKANVFGVDISEKALVVANENAQLNNVKVNFKLSNLFDNLKTSKKFDIIVSNPPYIPTKDIEKLDVEVKDYDPKLALDGGDDGLDFYRRIVKECPKYLSKNGMLFLEIGYGEKHEILELLKQDFENVRVIKDYNKIDRVVIAKLKDEKEKKNVRANSKNKAKI